MIQDSEVCATCCQVPILILSRANSVGWRRVREESSQFQTWAVGSCLVGLDDRIAKARRRSARHRRGWSLNERHVHRSWEATRGD